MIDNSRSMQGEQLSTLIGAMGAAADNRVPLEVTLAALAEDKSDPRLAAISRQLVAELERGVPIDRAIAKSERQLPAEIRGLLHAGIASGDLAGTFQSFADERLATQRIGRRIVAAIAYPLLVVAMLVPLVLFISIFIIPIFRDIYEEFELDLPAFTELVLSTGEQLPGVVGGLTLFLIAVPFVLRIVGGRWLFHRVRAAAPVVGPLWTWSGQREFAALLASFLDLRLPLSGAVVHTGAVMSDRNMSRACRRVAAHLESGQSLSDSLSQSIHFDRSLVALVAWGENKNLLPEALRITSEVFDDRIAQQSSLIQRLLPPVTLVAVGMMVFCVVIGLMLPLVRLIEALSTW